MKSIKTDKPEQPKNQVLPETATDDAKVTETPADDTDSDSSNRGPDFLLMATGDDLLNSAASVLASLSYMTRPNIQCNDPDLTRKKLSDQIQDIRSEHKNNPACDDCCLLLAAAIDEHMMVFDGNTLSRASLCSHIFHRRDAGVSCFAQINNYLKNPEQYQIQLHLAYLCLKTGFRGQFRRHGQEQHIELQVQIREKLANSTRLQKVPLPAPTITGRKLNLTMLHIKRPILISVASLIGLSTIFALWARTSQAPVLEVIQMGAKELQQAEHRSSLPDQESIIHAFYRKKQ